MKPLTEPVKSDVPATSEVFSLVTRNSRGLDCSPSTNARTEPNGPVTSTVTGIATRLVESMSGLVTIAGSGSTGATGGGVAPSGPAFSAASATAAAAAGSTGATAGT